MMNTNSHIAHPANFDIGLLIGRVLLGAIYALATFAIFTGKVPINFATNGANFIPVAALFVWIGYILKAVAGICVLTGFKTKTAAWVLIVFTLFTAFNYHDIGGAVFMKEVSMIGGLLILATVGPGRWSLDRD